jgi:hypothetical protein
MSARAIVRFWTLVLTAYVFLEEERARLRQLRETYVTIGEAQREVQRLHRAHLISWMPYPIPPRPHACPALPATRRLEMVKTARIVCSFYAAGAADNVNAGVGAIIASQSHLRRGVLPK